MRDNTIFLLRLPDRSFASIDPLGGAVLEGADLIIHIQDQDDTCRLALDI